MKKNTRSARWAGIGVPVLAGAALAAAVGRQLHDYDVPLSVLVACTLGVFTNVQLLSEVLMRSWTAVTYRCTEPGCHFRVQLTDAEPGEERRWQEAAACHPQHTLPS